MIRIEYKDLLEATEDIIAYTCSVDGVTSDDIAEKIKNKYQKSFKDYCTVVSSYQRVDIPVTQLLGSVLFTAEEDGKIVASMFTKYNLNGKYVTDRDKLKECLGKLKEYADKNNKSIALPYYIGCEIEGRVTLYANR